MAIVKFLSLFLYSFSFNIFSINYDGSLHNAKLKLSGSHSNGIYAIFQSKSSKATT